MSGLEWTTNDLWDPARLNKKTRFVGTGEQATSFITSPQIGQMIFSTESDSAYHHDKLAVYGSSSAWISPKLDEVAYSDTATADATLATSSTERRTYRFITLPTSEKFYIITKFSVNVGVVAGDKVTVGADLVDANPPVETNKMLVALGNEITTTAVNEWLDTTNVTSRPIRGGSILGIWGITDNTHGAPISLIKRISGTTTNYVEPITVYTSSPGFARTSVLSSTGSGTPAINVYYKGYI